MLPNSWAWSFYYGLEDVSQPSTCQCVCESACQSVSLPVCQSVSL
jgi:hypothetical protein